MYIYTYIYIYLSIYTTHMWSIRKYLRKRSAPARLSGRCRVPSLSLLSCGLNADQTRRSSQEKIPSAGLNGCVCGGLVACSTAPSRAPHQSPFFSTNQVTFSAPPLCSHRRPRGFFLERCSQPKNDLIPIVLFADNY